MHEYGIPKALQSMQKGDQEQTAELLTNIQTTLESLNLNKKTIEVLEEETKKP